MLQIKNIKKEYKTGGRKQLALNNVSLTLRDNEFVAILGPSGSGKTTMLNIIGGLDRYTEGDLIINGISTKKYSDRDWDSYRNHAVGFIFQSYNLIPHQTVLANVELALTISGIGKKERTERAKEALIKVGLEEHMHKLPSQMSGGQMQRVAIARALVNDPEILLADEPTGALDSETSIQIMDLLKEVAKDRLVVMVTHNPELAEEYATRIVKLKDGVIRDDSMPVEEETDDAGAKHKNMGKSSMSFFTALALSFNNLRTKLARTILVSFAGSIGIIGIALILSLSHGVNIYIKNIEEETLKEYPLQIMAQSFDLTALMPQAATDDVKERDDVEVQELKIASKAFATVASNDLGSLKKYLDNPESGMADCTRAVEYSYGTAPLLYKELGEDFRQVNPDVTFSALGFGNSDSMSSIMSMVSSTNIFYEMPKDENLYKEQYNVMAGRWPEKYNECIVVLTNHGALADLAIYAMGLRDPAELDKIVDNFMSGETEEIDTEEATFKYDDLIGIKFKLVNPADCYSYDEEYKLWTDKSGDKDYMKNLVKDGEDVTIVGVVRPKKTSVTAMLQLGINYPHELTEHVNDLAKASPIVAEQLANEEINVFTGKPFGEENQRDDANLEKLFTVDEDKMQKAFSIDESALAFDLSGLDMSGMDASSVVDPSAFNVNVPAMSEKDMQAMMSGVKIKMTSEDMEALFSQLMAGFVDYTNKSNDPSINFSNLQGAVQAYLQTDSAKGIIMKYLGAAATSAAQNPATPNAMATMSSKLLQGYSEYLKGKNLATLDLDAEWQAYLATEGAQTIMAEGTSAVMQQIMSVTLSEESQTKMMQELSEGYKAYASNPANNAPNPDKLNEAFAVYLSTPEGQGIIMSAVSKGIDTSAMEKQMAAAMSGYSEAIGAQISAGMQAMMGAVMQEVGKRVTDGITSAMGGMGDKLVDAFTFDADTFASAIKLNMSEQEIKELITAMMATGESTADGNLKKLGYVDPEKPAMVTIYPINFESKNQIKKILDGYNERMKVEDEDKVIVYTDLVGTMMKSVTDIINAISYVLIAFVSISLVVSSIMIGVITYISVLERRKEIGILRAIGASKHNISQVFNAETFIIGLLAGVLGIVITILLLIPANHIIGSLTTQPIRAILPVSGAFLLILLSVVLTLIGGIIPSRKAAKSDPVAALRSE